MNDTTDATAIFAPLWRRKWLILAVAVVVGAGSYFYYKRQPSIYSASTQVYLGSAAEEQAPGEKAATKLQAANVSNQVAVINTIIIEQVKLALRNGSDAALARTAKVKARNPEKSEFITIFVEGPHTARGAALMANLVAQAYIAREHAQHRRVVEKAISIAKRQLRRIEAATTPVPGKTGKGSGVPSTVSILRATTLSTKINELENTLDLGGAQQVKPAKAATAKLVSPQPRKDAIFGFVLGLVLAAIAAYMMSRFDRRLRSLAGIEDVLGSPVIAALPKVARPIVERDGAPSPSRVLLEPLRRMHAALQVGHGPEAEPRTARRVILVTSPDAGDGKSSVVAELALVQRDAGLRVAIVEANFRRPAQTRLLGVEGSSGLAEVLAGSVSVEDAMRRVTPGLPPEPAELVEPGKALATAVSARTGALFLLAGDSAVPNPPALLADDSVPALLNSLAAEYDYVLIDAPSPLEFSDIMPLLGVVGGIIIVARANHTREVAAGRLVELLQRSSAAPVLGLVANCVTRRDSERHGFSTPSGRGWPLKQHGR